MEQKISITLASILASVPKASANFKRSLTFVLQHEGIVYEVVLGDAGGATLCGITWQDYNAWRKEKGLPVRDLLLITSAEVAQVYIDHYWAPVHADALAYGLALTLFDAAVNLGRVRAVQWLQKTLAITADGAFGPATLSAAQFYMGAHGASALATAINTRRIAYYNQIGAPGKVNHKFLNGWLNRVADLKKEIA